VILPEYGSIRVIFNENDVVFVFVGEIVAPVLVIFLDPTGWAT
jgi:hypothetical protein